MAVVKLNGKNFEEEVLNAGGVIMVDFFADWCGPCKMLSPIVEAVSNELPEVKVCKLNTDEATDLAVKYQVMSIPTLLLLKDGELKDRSVGAISKSDMIAFIKNVF